MLRPGLVVKGGQVISSPPSEPDKQPEVNKKTDAIDTSIKKTKNEAAPVKIVSNNTDIIRQGMSLAEIATRLLNNDDELKLDDNVIVSFEKHAGVSYDDITVLMANYLSHITYDKAFYIQLMKFRLGWVNKNPNYALFLGGNLLGNIPIRFSSADDDMFFIDILGVDESVMREDIYKLKGINKAWKVTSNPMYLTLVYLMHKYSDKPTDLLQAAITELYYIFAYKAFSSLVSYFFKFDADEGLARAVYERLSNRYLIKELGSWHKVFEHRARDVLPGGLHWARVKNLNTDNSTRIIMDLQTRLRDIVKNIFRVLIEVRDNNEKIHSSSLIQTGEDNDSIREVINSPSRIIEYGNRIAGMPSDFINYKVVSFVNSIMSQHADNNEKFNALLKLISENIQQINEKHKKLNPNTHDTFVGDIINITIEYNARKGISNDYFGNVHSMLLNMKGFLSSSSVNNPLVKNIKYITSTYAQKVLNTTVPWKVSNMTISVILYIFARAVIQNKHQE